MNDCIRVGYRVLCTSVGSNGSIPSCGSYGIPIHLKLHHPTYCLFSGTHGVDFTAMKVHLIQPWVGHLFMASERYWIASPQRGHNPNIEMFYGHSPFSPKLAFGIASLFMMREPWDCMMISWMRYCLPTIWYSWWSHMHWSYGRMNSIYCLWSILEKVMSESLKWSY